MSHKRNIHKIVLLLSQYHKNDNPLVEQVAQPTQNTAVRVDYPYPYPPVSSDPTFNPQISNAIATNVLQMAHDVGETLLRTRNEKTEVFSPLSIYAALSLLLLGSGGNTYQELLNIMGLNKGKTIMRRLVRVNYFSIYLFLAFRFI